MRGLDADARRMGAARKARRGTNACAMNQRIYSASKGLSIDEKRVCERYSYSNCFLNTHPWGSWEGRRSVGYQRKGRGSAGLGSGVLRAKLLMVLPSTRQKLAGLTLQVSQEARKAKRDAKTKKKHISPTNWSPGHKSG
jgi:hypothetical protein